MAGAGEHQLPEPRTSARVGMVLLDDGSARYSDLLPWVFVRMLAVCIFAAPLIGADATLVAIAVAVYWQRFGTTVSRDGLTVRRLTRTRVLTWDEVGAVTFNRNLRVTLTIPGEARVLQLPMAIPNSMDLWARIEAMRAARSEG
jgi:hypothetical protein